MIETLNTDYARTNSDENVTRVIFQPVAEATDIQFCLAQTDPNGNITTGITRTQSDHGVFSPNQGDPNTAENAKTTAAGGIDPWDQTRYLNIWI